MVTSDQPAATQAIEAYLLPGEELLWVGRPKQGFALRGMDAVLIPASLLVTAWIIKVVIDLLLAGQSLLLPIVLPFLAGGSFLLVGRFYIDARRRTHTLYVLSNSRALIITGDKAHNIRSINLKTLREISFSHRVDGTGTIEFDRQSGWMQDRYEMSRGMDWPWLSYESMRNPAFEMIENPWEVERLILAARDRAQAAAGGSIRRLADETR